MFTTVTAQLNSVGTEKATGPYLETLEGAVAAFILVELSFLSFVTIIDRSPTTVAGSPLFGGSGSSPEGLFVVPHSSYFPANFEL